MTRYEIKNTTQFKPMENRGYSIYEVGILVGDNQSDKLKIVICSFKYQYNLYSLYFP